MGGKTTRPERNLTRINLNQGNPKEKGDEKEDLPPKSLHSLKGTSVKQTIVDKCQLTNN